jgi:hypothetical protein
MAEVTLTQKSTRRLKATGFVLVAIVLWYLFAVLANRVVACAPQVTALRSLQFGSCTQQLSSVTAMIITLVALPFAMWASARMFYSTPDE